MSGLGIGDRLEREWDHEKHAVADWFRRETSTVTGAHPYDATSQAPADTPVTLATAPAPPEGEPMSLSADLQALAARVEKFDEEALSKLEAVANNGETKAVLGDLASLAGVVGIPAGTIASIAAPLKTLLGLYANDPAQPAPAPVPAPSA